MCLTQLQNLRTVTFSACARPLQTSEALFWDAESLTLLRQGCLLPASALGFANAYIQGRNWLATSRKNSSQRALEPATTSLGDRSAN